MVGEVDNGEEEQVFRRFVEDNNTLVFSVHVHSPCCSCRHDDWLSIITYYICIYIYIYINIHSY